MDSNDVRQKWEGRSGEYSPAYYAHYGSDETSESIRALLDEHVGRDASVLELGCSSGRHLAHLLDEGFESLAGIELNDDAFDVMAEQYPDLRESGTFYETAIEAVIGDFEDGQFDAVYSVQTLQHVHPDAAWVFAEIARVTDTLLVTVEIESEAEDADRIERNEDPDVNYVRDEFPLYYRNWREIFEPLGFEQVDQRSGKRDTLRAFRSK